MFTASAYCLAIFLAVLAVAMAKKGWRWAVAGSLLLALSMGIYQAYAAVAVALSVLLILKQCLSHRAQCKETAVLGVRLLAFLAVGAVAYYVILQVFLKVKGLELLEYLGMSQAGSGYPIAQSCLWRSRNVLPLRQRNSFLDRALPSAALYYRKRNVRS